MSLLTLLVAVGVAGAQIYIFKRLQDVESAAREQPDIPDYGNPGAIASDAADEARAAHDAAMNAESAAYQARDAARDASDAAHQARDAAEAPRY